MGDALRRRIKQTRFISPLQEAMLNVAAAANYLRERTDRIVGAKGLTGPQYNVLRILRGVHPEGHPRGEIAARMLDRAPDVTRIIDRLEEKGLVARDRDDRDRRCSITRITKKGLALLEEIDPEMMKTHAELRKRFTDRDAEELSRLCELIYDSE